MASSVTTDRSTSAWTFLTQGLVQTFNIPPSGGKYKIVIEPPTGNIMNVSFTEAPLVQTTSFDIPHLVETKEGHAFLMYGDKLKIVPFYFDHLKGTRPSKLVSWEEYYAKILEDIIEQNKDPNISSKEIQLFFLRVDHCDEPLSRTNFHSSAFDFVAILPPLSFPFFAETSTYVKVRLLDDDTLEKKVYLNDQTTFGEFLYRLSVVYDWLPNQFSVFYLQKKEKTGKRRKTGTLQQFVVEKRHLLKFPLSSPFVKAFQALYKELPYSTQTNKRFRIQNTL